ncbi:hypothetical protein Tco_0925056 [Tanacetum coccineum]|uniref:Uncharacterized protein n=1 Tax=Tanacetum coccineum TaxID=301880 RepID=A0ABQ5D8E8_9ASTR
MPQTSSDQLADNLHDVMMETLPSLVKEKVTEQVSRTFPVAIRDQSCVTCWKAHISSQIQNFNNNAIPSLLMHLITNKHSNLGCSPYELEKTQVPQSACRSSVVRTRDQDDPHDDAHPEGEIFKKAEDI